MRLPCKVRRLVGVAMLSREDHAGSCLQCQAREALAGRLQRELGALRALVISAPLDLEWRVMSGLEGRHPRRSPPPVPALVAAGVSAAAVVFWWARPRSQG